MNGDHTVAATVIISLFGFPKVTEDRSILILTRKIGETIRIGDDVKIAVLGVKGNQVRIGIAASKDVPVHREEIWERIQWKTGLLNRQKQSVGH